MTIPLLAICAIARNEASYIEEWIAFHRRQGVTLFRIYDNASLDGTSEVCRAQGVELIYWNDVSSDFDQQQTAAYLDGARQMAGRAAWVGFIDIDEFIFGRYGRTLAKTLAMMPAGVGAVAVQQRVFGSGGQITRVAGGVVERFIHCAPLDHSEHLWFKTIARPDHVDGFDSVHSVVLRAGSYVMQDGSPLVRKPGQYQSSRHAAEGAIGLHHYMLKSLEEFRQKQIKWVDRGIPGRLDDSYFLWRDGFANLIECREAIDL